MKKLVILSLAIIAWSGCRKEKNNTTNPNTPLTYEEKLVGNWDLDSIYYETEIPSLTGGPATPVEDSGENVSGEFIITKGPNELSYNYTFTANVPTPVGGNINVPVSQEGDATWTVASDNSEIYLKSPEDESTVYEVVRNEDNLQEFKTVIDYNLQGFINIEVTAYITLKRAN